MPCIGVMPQNHQRAYRSMLAGVALMIRVSRLASAWGTARRNVTESIDHSRVALHPHNEIAFACSTLGSHQPDESPTLGCPPRVQIIDQSDERCKALVRAALIGRPAAAIANRQEP